MSTDNSSNRPTRKKSKGVSNGRPEGRRAASTTRLINNNKSNLAKDDKKPATKIMVRAVSTSVFTKIKSEKLNKEANTNTNTNTNTNMNNNKEKDSNTKESTKHLASANNSMSSNNKSKRKVIVKRNSSASMNSNINSKINSKNSNEVETSFTPSITTTKPILVKAQKSTRRNVMTEKSKSNNVVVVTTTSNNNGEGGKKEPNGNNRSTRVVVGAVNQSSTRLLSSRSSQRGISYKKNNNSNNNKNINNKKINNKSNNGDDNEEEKKEDERQGRSTEVVVGTRRQSSTRVSSSVKPLRPTMNSKPSYFSLMRAKKPLSAVEEFDDEERKGKGKTAGSFTAHSSDINADLETYDDFDIDSSRFGANESRAHLNHNDKHLSWMQRSFMSMDRSISFAVGKKKHLVRYDRDGDGNLDHIERTVRAMDKKGDGVFDVKDIFEIVEILEKEKKQSMYVRKHVVILVIIAIVLLAIVEVLFFCTVSLMKEVTLDIDNNLVGNRGDKSLASTHPRGVKLALSKIDLTSAVNSNNNLRHLQDESKNIMEECPSGDGPVLIGKIPTEEFESQWENIADNNEVRFEFLSFQNSINTINVNGHDIQKTNLSIPNEGIVRYTGLLDARGTSSSSSTTSNSNNMPTTYYHLYCNNEECNVYKTIAPTIIVTSVTTDSSTFAFRTDFPSSNIRIEVALSSFNGDNDSAFYYDDSTATTTTTASTDCTGYVIVDGLKSDTQYYYRLLIDDVEIVSDYIQTYRTYPKRKATKDGEDSEAFSFVIFSDSDNAKDYNAIPTYENAGKEDALFAIQIGDFDHSEPSSLEDYRLMHRNLRNPQYYQGKLLTEYILSKMSIWHTWNDHDYCGTRYGNKTSADNSNEEEDYCEESRKANAFRAFREYYPNYPYGYDDKNSNNNNKANYYSFAAGDAEIIVLDTQSQRQNSSITNTNTSSMLGETQKAWLMNKLLSTNARWKFIISSVNANKGASFAGSNGSTNSVDSNSWSAYQEEAEEIQTFISSSNILNVIMITGDLHLGGGAIDFGCNNLFGVPELNVAPTNIRGQRAKNEFGGMWSSITDSTHSNTDPGYAVVVVQKDKVMLVNKNFDGSKVHQHVVLNNNNDYLSMCNNSIE